MVENKEITCEFSTDIINFGQRIKDLEKYDFSNPIFFDVLYSTLWIDRSNISDSCFLSTEANKVSDLLEDEFEEWAVRIFGKQCIRSFFIVFYPNLYMSMDRISFHISLTIPRKKYNFLKIKYYNLIEYLDYDMGFRHVKS